MHDQFQKGPEVQPGGEDLAKKAWTDPEIKLKTSLSRVTNGMAGSFDPNGGGGAANGGPGQGNTGGKTRDWGQEP